ncbi:MAG: hypothetical protein R2822_14475 [Spirosomataceae bacterium]
MAIGYAYRGKCHLVENNLYSALYDFTRALSFDNTLEDIHFDKGSVHYLLEEYHEAFLSFDKAVWFREAKITRRLTGVTCLQESLSLSLLPKRISKQTFLKY